MPSISPFITYETLHCVHQHKRNNESTSKPSEQRFQLWNSKKKAGFARVIKLKKTVPEPKNFASFGECCRLRERIDMTRANQKPLLHIARTNHLAVFDIAINLRRP